MTNQATAPGILTREEWMRRFATRLVEVGGLDQKTADESAEAGWEMSGEDQDIYSPEDCADDEMSYWGD